VTSIIVGRTGAGPALVLLHAFPLNAQMWDLQAAALGGQATVLTPDLPGFGASGGATPVEDLDALAAMLYEELRGRGVARAVVAGCSMGGYLAFGLLRVAPHFVRGLALIDTKASADTDAARASRLELVRRVEREGCSFLAHEWPPSALSPTTLAHRPQVVRAVQDMVARATPSGVIAAQKAMAARPDSTGLLAQVGVPTVVVHGLDDPIVSEAQSGAMAAAIAGAEFVGVPSAGHLPGIEQPEQLNGALRDLMRRVAERDEFRPA
jgi:pimeloyl-ACP methyl ester carboxylesterase